jgi:hypothetical protein
LGVFRTKQEGVIGSNPFASTNKIGGLIRAADFFYTQSLTFFRLTRKNPPHCSSASAPLFLRIRSVMPSCWLRAVSNLNIVYIYYRRDKKKIASNQLSNKKKIRLRYVLKKKYLCEPLCSVKISNYGIENETQIKPIRQWISV